MSESENVPRREPKYRVVLERTCSEEEARRRMSQVYDIILESARAKQRTMEQPTRWGIFFKWHKEDEDDEWFCDHTGVIFVFDFRDEAEAMRHLLDLWDGVDVEVKPYDGDEPTREYPWPVEELITV